MRAPSNSIDSEGETIDGGGSLAEDSTGDFVFAGDDDEVVGGLGDDHIDGGAAHRPYRPTGRVRAERELYFISKQGLARTYN